MDDTTPPENENRSMSASATSAENIFLNSTCLMVPEGIEQVLWDLLKKKAELKNLYLAAQDDKMILNEIMKNPQEWITSIDAEKQREMSEEEEITTEREMNAVMEKRMDKMNEVIDNATTVIDTWKHNAELLSQKIEKLKLKMVELEGVNACPNLKCDVENLDSNQNALAFLKIELKNKHEKMKVLIEAAQKERDIIKERVTRMETTLQHLCDTQTQLERKCLEDKNLYQSWKNSLSEMETLCGVKCKVVDQSTLEITLQAKDLINSTEISMESSDDLDDCKFSATLKFTVNQQGSLEVTDVLTQQNVEEVKKLITQVKQDKDLPKFVSSLRSTWLSYLPLNAEICCLRKSHAIDFVQEQGVLQLIINKRNIVCTLKVPKSYPHADVTLMNVMGHAHLTAENISAPSAKTLTPWIKYLEDLLGQQ